MSYNPNYQKQMAPQHIRHPQQQYPPQMGGHQRGYPNYPYPAYVSLLLLLLYQYRKC